MKINSDLIIKALKESKLSSYKIAQDTGISDQTIQNYRDDKTRPKGANLATLAKYLDIAIAFEKNKVLIIEAKPPMVNEPPVELFLCPECVNKKKEIDSWIKAYSELSKEMHEVNRKYRELLESKVEVKKETSNASDQKTC